MRHNTYIKSIVVMGLLLTAHPFYSAAQNERNLTLDEAIQLGLQNSKQLKLSMAKQDEAKSVWRQAKENMLPDAKVSGAYLRVDNPTVDLKVKLGSSSNNSGSGSGSGTGEGTAGGASSIKVNQAAYALGSVSMPLFSGLRVHYGIESAKYLAEAARLDVDNDKEAVVENTVDAYNNLYKSREAVELVKENLKQSKQRVTDFTNLEQNGLLARNDLLKAELQESNIELSLLDAENNYNIASINMDLMLGLPENTMLVPDSNAFNTLNDPGTITEWENTALQNRKDLAALDYREKAAFANIKSIKGEYYPGIALTGNYIAADIPNLLTLTNAISGGIGVQYNISSLWKTGSKVQQARARQHQIEANQEMLNDQIRTQINQAYQNYLVSRKKIDVYAKAIEQANENYKITKNKYDNSLVTTTDLLDADVAQLQAKLNYAFAKSDAVATYIRLQQTAGVLYYNKNNNK